jgi:hypothetical protein
MKIPNRPEAAAFLGTCLLDAFLGFPFQRMRGMNWFRDRRQHPGYARKICNRRHDDFSLQPEND